MGSPHVFNDKFNQREDYHDLVIDSPSRLLDQEINLPLETRLSLFILLLIHFGNCEEILARIYEVQTQWLGGQIDQETAGRSLAKCSLEFILQKRISELTLDDLAVLSYAISDVVPIKTRYVKKGEAEMLLYSAVLCSSSLVLSISALKDILDDLTTSILFEQLPADNLRLAITLALLTLLVAAFALEVTGFRFLHDSHVYKKAVNDVHELLPDLPTVEIEELFKMLSMLWEDASKPTSATFNPYLEI